MTHLPVRKTFGSGGDLLAKAEEIIENHVYIAMGIGLLPMPFVDLIALTGIQLNLTRKLSKLHNLPFSENRGKNIIGALTGGCFSASIGSRILFSATKTVPLVGGAVGLTGSAIIAGASTYAIGKVFHRHFLEGGTFLSFDSTEARAFYEEMFRQGEKRVQQSSRSSGIFHSGKTGFMAFTGKVIAGLDTLTKSKSTMFVINKGISRYGRLSDLDIDRANRRISVSIILKGDDVPTEMIIQGYEIKKKASSTGLIVYNASANKEWLSEILQNFVINKTLEVPPGKEKIIKGLLGIS